MNSLNQFLKISNYLKTYSTSIPEAKVSHSPPELPSGCVKGQQLQQHRIQFPQRQMENVLGKCQFVTNNEIKKKKNVTHVVAQTVKNLPTMPETQTPKKGWHPTPSSMLAWRIPGTEESGVLQSVGSQRLGQD